MAREFIDGFETGDFSLWNTLTGSNNFILTASTYGMSGAKCAQIYNGKITKNVTARDYYYFAFKFRLNYMEAMSIFMLYNSGTVLGTLKLTVAGNLQLNSGAATVCATGTKVIAINTTYLIEVMYQPKTDGTGRFTVKVDGITDSDFTGVTSPSALQINQFSIGGSQTEYFDDVIVDSAAWIGTSKIQALVSSGAGASTQWTPSTGANYACVDEVPTSDADFISTNTINNIDTFAMSDLSGSGLTIKSVQLVVRANYSGAPATTSMKGVVRTAGANYASAATYALATSFADYATLWENNPATSSPWSSADVNALEAGVKAV